MMINESVHHIPWRHVCVYFVIAMLLFGEITVQKAISQDDKVEIEWTNKLIILNIFPSY